MFEGLNVWHEKFGFGVIQRETVYCYIIRFRYSTKQIQHGYWGKALFLSKYDYMNKGAAELKKEYAKIIEHDKKYISPDMEMDTDSNPNKDKKPSERVQKYQNYIERKKLNDFINAKNLEIKEILAQYKVTQLIHFTPIVNVPSIIKQGIVPRAIHWKEGIHATYTDPDRFDDKRVCTSMSISFPNYKMLRVKSSKQNPFAILVIDPAVLYEQAVTKRFFSSNAANYSMREQMDSFSQSVKALQLMFDDTDMRLKRKLPLNYTTDPQAEVLYSSKIHPKYIKEIHVYSSVDRGLIEENLRGMIPISMIKVNKKFFQPRMDYMYWSKK